MQTTLLRRLPVLPFLILILSLQFLSSCKKADTVGLEVLPDEDRLQGEYSDTATVIAYIMREDTLLTSNRSFHVLGSHNDPIFGLSSSDIYSQFVLESVSPDFTGALLDSVVLSLGYAGYYADVMKLGGVQSFTAHRLTEDITDSLYSDDELAYQGAPLGTYTGLIAAHDSVMVNGKVEPPQMRIRLDNTFGTEILQSGALANDSSFLQQFKGLYITPATQGLLPGMGSLIYINPASPYTKVTLYYHSDTIHEFDLVVKSTTKRFSHFTHDYTGAPDITAQLADSSLGTEHLYLQAMAGLKVKLVFPYLKNYVTGGKKIAINRAEILFPVAAGTTARLSPPARMAIVKKASSGNDTAIVDNITEASDFVGGFYNSSDKEFKFNIPRHIQSLMNDTTADNSVYLRLAGAAVSGNRVVLNGTGNTDKPLKLKLTYTIIE